MERDRNGRGSGDPALVGRADELSFLTDAADRAVEEGATMVIVSGEAGIGKSTLITEFLANLSAGGWATHVGYCIEYADRPLPFGPIVPILRSILLDRLDSADDLLRHHRTDLAGLLPELRDDGVPSPSLAGDVDRLFDAITLVIGRSTTDRPTALFVEDIHWADAATRDLLTSMTRSLGRTRVLLIVSERTGAIEKTHPLRTWLAEQRRFPNVRSLDLVGFSPDELAEQATNILGETPDPDFITELAERTSGNAYFAGELLRARLDGDDTSLPSTLADLLTSRLERLDGAERSVLRAIAIAGGSVSHTVLSMALPDTDVASGVRSLFDRTLLVVDGQDYTFRHALLREAILRDLLPFEAEDLHRRVAEAIVADPRTGSSPADLASLALHWAGANDHRRSLEANVAAASASAKVAAYETAAELSLEALRLWPTVDEPETLTTMTRDELLVSAADCLVSSNRAPEGADLIQNALDGWARDLPRGRRALLEAKLAPIRFMLGDPTEATRLLDRAVETIGDERSAEAAEIHHRVSKQAVAEGLIHPARRAASRATEIARTCGPDYVLVEALTTQGLAVGVTEDQDEGIRLVRSARELGLDAALVAQVAQTFRTEMMIINFREGRTDASIDVLYDGLRYAEENCGPSIRLDITLDLALGLVEAGRLVEADPLVDAMLKSEPPNRRRLAMLQVAGLSRLLRNDLDAAGAYLAEGTELADQYRIAQDSGFQNRLLAELARKQGDLDGARKLIDEALATQLTKDNVTFTRESIVEKIRLAAAMATRRVDLTSILGEITDARTRLAVDDPASRAMDSLMELELAAVDGPVEVEAIAATLAGLERTGFAPDAALTRLRLADALAAAPGDRRDELTTLLETIVERATASGMTWMVGRAGELAANAGLALDAAPEPAPTATQPTASPPHDLTARELEVLALLAEGLTNKGIGERLYVSHRTVSTHVSNVLAKLHVSNRAEAATAYHRLGLDVIDLRSEASDRSGR